MAKGLVSERAKEPYRIPRHWTGLTLIAASLMLVTPLWNVWAPAMPDYPAHLASFALIEQGTFHHGVPGTNSFYHLHWSFVPNLASEIIVPLLARLTGVVAAQAITAALLARERTGEGQHVQLSMLDAVVAFLWGSDMGSQTFVGDELPQQEAASFIDLIYETKDDYISAAVQTDREWAALTRALGRPEWLDDPRFATPALRHKHIDERLTITQEVLRTRPAAEWLERLTAEGVPCAPVLTRSRMIEHPQVVANGVVIETEHPGAGLLRQARPAARFSGTPTSVRRGAPELGEHTDQILTEIGFTEDAIP